MKKSKLKRLLAGAVDAARLAGKLMRKNLRAVKKVNAATQNDIKLELDVRCQKTIEKCLLKAFPKIPIFGEEGICGPQEGEFRWVVDPIDGTVNYACGIPHACVSIALQRVSQEDPHSSAGIVVGVVYDPFLDELWTAVEGGPARLNGRKIHVSERRSLDEAILITGFAKEGKNLPVNLKLF